MLSQLTFSVHHDTRNFTEKFYLNVVTNSMLLQQSFMVLKYMAIFVNKLYFNINVIFYCIPGGSDGKESACNAGDLGSISWSGRSPGGGHGKPLQYSCLENFHGQRSLASYSPWACKELNTTERLSTAQHMCMYKCIPTVRQLNITLLL